MKIEIIKIIKRSKEKIKVYKMSFTLTKSEVDLVIQLYNKLGRNVNNIVNKIIEEIKKLGTRVPTYNQVYYQINKYSKQLQNKIIEVPKIEVPKMKAEGKRFPKINIPTVQEIKNKVFDEKLPNFHFKMPSLPVPVETRHFKMPSLPVPVETGIRNRVNDVLNVNWDDILTGTYGIKSVKELPFKVMDNMMDLFNNQGKEKKVKKNNDGKKLRKDTSELFVNNNNEVKTIDEILGEYNRNINNDKEARRKADYINIDPFEEYNRRVERGNNIGSLYAQRTNIEIQKNVPYIIAPNAEGRRIIDIFLAIKGINSGSNGDIIRDLQNGWSGSYDYGRDDFKDLAENIFSWSNTPYEEGAIFRYLDEALKLSMMKQYKISMDYTEITIIPPEDIFEDARYLFTDNTIFKYMNEGFYRSEEKDALLYYAGVNFDEAVKELTSSSFILNLCLWDVHEISIEEVEPIGRKNGKKRTRAYNPKHGYFKYLNESNYDLRKYQIYRECDLVKNVGGQEINLKIIDIQCLRFTLFKIFDGVNGPKLSEEDELYIKRIIKNNIKEPAKKLTEIGNKFKCIFEFMQLKPVNDSRTIYDLRIRNANRVNYPENRARNKGKRVVKEHMKDWPVYHIGGFEGHFFINDEYILDDGKVIKSVKLIGKLFNEGFFRNPSKINIRTKRRKNKIETDLSNIENEQKYECPIEKRNGKELRKLENKSEELAEKYDWSEERREEWVNEKYEENKVETIEEAVAKNNECKEWCLKFKLAELAFIDVGDIKIFNHFIDNEANFVERMKVNKNRGERRARKEKRHSPFLFGSVPEGKNNEVKIIRNNYKDPFDPRFIKDILRSYSEGNVHILKAHNAKYDYNLWRSIGLPLIVNDTVKDAQFYSIEFYFENRYFIIQDTYKKVVTSLDNFGEMFALDSGKKHYVLYDLYREKCRLQNKLVVRNYRHNAENQERINKQEIIVYNDNDGRGFTRTKGILENVRYVIIDDYAIIPYYCIEMMGSKYFNNLYYLNIIKDQGEVIEINNIDTEMCVYRHVDHYTYYLIHDCLTLKNGMSKFNNIMGELMNDIVLSRLTLSGMADTYALINKCYVGVNKVKGNLRNYLKEASCGGRTMLANNLKKKVTNTCIQYLDACSLYPSAIIRMCKELGGLPVGDAIKYTERQISYINEGVNSKDKIERLKSISLAGCIEVIINKVGINRPLPCWGRLEDNKRNWTNDLVGDYKYIIDTITVEDLVVFQDIEFEVTRGIYWTEFNKKLGEIILRLYSERSSKKRAIKNIRKSKQIIGPDGEIEYELELTAEEKSAIKSLNITQEHIKLILNSIYGKNGLKASECERVYKTGEDIKAYEWSHFDDLISGDSIKLLTNNEDIEEYEDVEVTTNEIIGYDIINTKPIYAKKTVKENVSELSSELFYLFSNEHNLNENTLEDYKQRGEIKEQVMFKNSKCEDQGNQQQISMFILSFSKRIMHECACLADDLKIECYMTDTDSLVFDGGKNNENYHKLVNDFKIKYNRDLIGDELGQFKLDYEYNGHQSLYGSDGIFLGKKAYIIKVMGEKKLRDKEGKLIRDSEGKPISIWESKYTYRLKGIPVKCLKQTCKAQFDGDMWKLYEYLYKGNTVTFDLVGGDCISFNLNQDGVISDLERYRRIKFL